MASSKRTNLEPHPLVAALQPDPDKLPVRALKLFGFPGKSPESGKTRLWLDTDLCQFVDIPADSIHYSTTLPDDAGTVVWVAPEAELNYGSNTATTPEEFLSGSIASQRLRGGEGLRPDLPNQTLPQPSFGVPCYSQPPFCLQPSIQQACVSHLTHACNSLLGGVCPSRTLICQSAPVICQSHYVVCHSFAVPCLSQGQICPTIKVICNQSVLQCPSLGHQICPTAPVICNHQSLLVLCPTKGPAICPTLSIACTNASVQCPSQFCPSVGTPCHSIPACPTIGACPSIACGGNEGPFGGGGVG